MAKTHARRSALEPVIIDLTYGPASPDPAYATRGQEIIWKVNAGDALQITFHDGKKPLGWSQKLGFRGDGLSGRVQGDTKNGTYAYHPVLVALMDEGAAPPHTVFAATDPEIVVDGGDRGGGRKQSRLGARKGARKATASRKTAAKKRTGTKKKPAAKKKVARKATRKAAKKK